MNELHICYTIDKDYYHMCLMSIYHLIAHKNEGTKLIIYILSSDDFCHAFHNRFNSIKNVEVRDITIPSEFEPKLNRINELQKFSKAMYSRWIIPKIWLFQKVNRVLYVDADTFAMKDLTSLYNTDLEGKALGLCKSQYRILYEYRTKDTFDKFDPFVNEGVMLMDCAKLNELNATEMMFEELMWAYPFVTDEMIVTQNLLNETKFLPPTANLLYPVLLEKYPYIDDIFYWNALNNTNYKSFEDLLRKTEVIHMFGKKINLRTDPKLSKIYSKLYENFMTFLYTETIDTNTKELDNEILSI